MRENTGGSNGGSCGPAGDDGHACPGCDKQVCDTVIVIKPCCVTTAKGGTIFVVKK